MKHKPAPTNAEIRKALDFALLGRGRKLAAIVKAFSEEDLAAGISRAGGLTPHALFFAAGRKQGRAEMAATRRENGKRCQKSEESCRISWPDLDAAIARYRLVEESER